eukprot:4434588-Prymnesium_polylepis.1
MSVDDLAPPRSASAGFAATTSAAVGLSCAPLWGATSAWVGTTLPVPVPSLVAVACAGKTSASRSDA